MSMKNIVIYIILAALAIPLFFLHIHDVHNWGDDFAQYIKQAQNIAQGKPFYLVDYIFNPLNPEYGPPYYPVGFSLLLAPVIKIWGLSIHHMLLFMSLIMACLLFTLYHFFRNVGASIISSVCMALICVYCSGVLELKAQVLSDIPCWLFSYLYITLRLKKEKNYLILALMVLAATMAILIRTQAAVLIIAESILFAKTFLHTVIKERKVNWKNTFNTFPFKAIVATTLLYIIFSKIIFSVPSSMSSSEYYLRLLTHHNGTWGEAITNNVKYLYILINRSFHYYPELQILALASDVITSFLLTLSILGLIRSIRLGLTYIDIYFLLSIILLAVLSQQQGIRFVVYILPLSLYYAYSFLKVIVKDILPVNGKIVAVLFTLFYFTIGRGEFKYASSGYVPPEYIPTEEDKTAFNYIKENVKDNEVILYAKPRALSLFTTRKAVVSAWQVSTEENQHFFTENGVTHALLNKEVEDGFTENYIRNRAIPSDSVQITENYTLYKF